MQQQQREGESEGRSLAGTSPGLNLLEYCTQVRAPFGNINKHFSFGLRSRMHCEAFLATPGAY